MAKSMTEDEVRRQAHRVLGFDDVPDGVRAGTGQITTFNQLGFLGVIDKPDGWWLPDNTAEVAMVLETKSTSIALREAQVDELLKNVKILMRRYDKVVGILYNGDEVRVFKCLDEVHVAPELQAARYYLDLYTPGAIDKEHIYELTARINDCLHFEFGVKNLYHRMISRRVPWLPSDTAVPRWLPFRPLWRWTQQRRCAFGTGVCVPCR